MDQDQNIFTHRPMHWASLGGDVRQHWKEKSPHFFEASRCLLMSVPQAPYVEERQFKIRVQQISNGSFYAIAYTIVLKHNKKENKKICSNKLLHESRKEIQNKSPQMRCTSQLPPPHPSKDDRMGL